ncbi:multidrug efflux system membrane fusion protein [Bradyrhizobium sp. GM6.1]
MDRTCRRVDWCRRRRFRRATIPSTSDNAAERHPATGAGRCGNGAQPRRADLPAWRRYGDRPQQRNHTRSQITGQLVKISFKQGQTVKKGDVLAEIDPRPYQAQLDQAIANRDRDQAQVVNAKANLNRYEPLAQKGWASTQLVDTTKAQLAQLEAMVKSDEGVIAQANTNLSYTQLISPIDGVTGIRQVDNGNIIHPTDANGLVDVTQIQPISLIFSLPQTDFVEIQRQMANRPLKVLAYSQDDSTELDEGKLGLVDNQIVQTTGTVRLRASFPNAKRLLWPGELINARLLLETRQNGLTIPSSAIQQGPQGSFVWVIGPNETVTTRPVKVAYNSDGDALIDSGLQANEKVVVDGQYRLQPGAHVKELVGAAAQGANLQSSVEQEIP